MAKQANNSGSSTTGANTTSKTGRPDGIIYIATYFFSWLSGILVYLTMGQTNKSLKFHAVQSTILGGVFIILYILLFIVSFALFFFGGYLIATLVWLIIFVLWLYSLYVGYQASQGKDIEMPVIGQIARNMSN